MFHLIWYILIGLISGVIRKISDDRAYDDLLDDRALGIIGIYSRRRRDPHVFSRPANERYHPAGLISFPYWERS